MQTKDLGTKFDQKPDPPCVEYPNPLGLGQDRFTSYEVKSFDIHPKNLPIDFPYRLQHGSRIGTFKILYFEFQSIRDAKDHPDTGFPGDVWIQKEKTAEGKIYYKGGGGRWKLWKGPQATKQSIQDYTRHGRHPLLARSYLWFNGSELNWRTRETIRSHDPETPEPRINEIVSIIKGRYFHLKRTMEECLELTGKKKRRVDSPKPHPGATGSSRVSSNKAETELLHIDSPPPSHHPEETQSQQSKSLVRRPPNHIIDLTCEVANDDPIAEFIRAIGLSVPTTDLVLYLNSEGVVSAGDLDRYAGLAKRRPVMFSNEGLAGLKKENKLVWMAIVDALQEKEAAER